MLSYVLAAVSGAFYFLGWAGFDIWPLAFVAFVPALWALDPQHETKPTAFGAVVRIGFVFGLVMNIGGFYWVASTLEVFSGFPYFWCILIASIFWAFQGLSLSLFAWLYRRLRGYGAPNLVAAPAALCLTEWIFPELFPHYFGGSLHDAPLAIQVADFGGPLLVSGLLVAANVALYELSLVLKRKKIELRTVAAVAVMWIATLSYGAFRIHEVDARAAEATKITVGMVQTNMGLMEKRKNPREGQRRHLEQSVQLEREGSLDLLIWSETAFSWWLPNGTQNVRNSVLGGVVHTPTLFGGLARRERNGETRSFNTAFMTDASGAIVGTYDKTFLLAFGEYIPFGETFPQIYELSPRSGRFAAGDHVHPLQLGPYRLSVLICYEDILPSFVSRAIREGTPHLLVNITNDAWFGNTHQPWEHLALAKFRAVEHHRALVRSTNSGVSAVIDPVGRMVAHGPVFERDNLRAEVPMMQGDYAYLTLGDFPGYLSLLTVFGLSLRSRSRRGRAPAAA